MNMAKRIYARFRRRAFKKGFRSFGSPSGMGPLGYGDTCEVKGCENISVGSETWIGHHCEIIAMSNHYSQKLNPDLKIGDRVHINSRTRITCAESVTIEDDVLIAPDVFVTDCNHGLDPVYEGGYSPQKLATAPVHIGRGVWLGRGVCVLPGVTVGAHSIVGAMSTVTQDIPDFCIAVGSPARVVKMWDLEREEWRRVKR